ncbi:long-chain-acyl-CoA dehydrogenase [Nocardioides scoriae]|uniref:Long-chain-acyl-CoA dehydrogenase n=1 Tax=Nocardioides scoriae TaxID=642780 RepID=A0A1H1VHH0_9ACTN|nr:acyl-CoA dehydrogenase family protein [Nocardioides scoriae]SDS84183.1 long-chain-acyl-CoA dehydrogenase [Nocardioides scoriae]
MKRDIYDEDHEAFRASVRGFLRGSVTPNLDQHVTEKAIPREFWLDAGMQGFLGLEIPEEYGGAGAEDYRFNAVVAEELSKVNAALGSCWGIHADITAPYLVELGTEEQKQRWLPGVAAGEILLAIGMTEPSGGSDLAALKTTGVRDGDQWVINGSKTFITNGYSADLVITAVRTSPEKKARGITLFAIPASAEGFSRGRKLDKVGQDEADTAELFFENVRLTDDHIIGEVDSGFIHMMQKLPQERLGCAISNLAHAKQILEETLQYTKERTAFGAPIGSFQHSKFLLAEMFTQVDVSQAYVDQCVAAHDRGQLTPIDAAKAKFWTSEIQNKVIDHCVQLHGGYGYMNEYRVARAWRDARVSRIWAGSNEIMKELIGRDLGL